MDRRPLIVVGVVLALFAAVFFYRQVGNSEASDSTTTTSGSTPTTGAPGSTPATTTPGPEMRVGYLISKEGAVLASGPGGSGPRIAGGIRFPIIEATGDGYRIMDACGRDGWLAASDVDEGLVPIDRRTEFGDAVFVIDPGHGLPDLGAVGPNRVLEGQVNLKVAARLQALLEAPHDIDWATGTVTPGTAYPAVSSVILTRSPEGPNGGDYEMPLTFRSLIANSAEATALVSIHHNSGHSRSLEGPGSEAYVQVHNPESARLGGLIVDELRKGLGRFEADWVGGVGNGLRSRHGSTGGDYYTVLDEADGVAVIVEGAYISNPSEEALIATDEFQQAYAEAVYRALVRWITTPDDPLPRPEPEPYPGPGGPGRNWDNCVVPPAGG